MSHAHAVAVPSRSRIYRLAPVVLVTLVLALVTLALVQDGGGEQVADRSPAAPTGAINYGDWNLATGRPHSAPLPQPSLSTERPDESVVAAAIGGGYQSAQNAERPDESVVAASVAQAFKSPAPAEDPTPFGGHR
jgi:hypothetical protein